MITASRLYGVSQDVISQVAKEEGVDLVKLDLHMRDVYGSMSKGHEDEDLSWAPAICICIYKSICRADFFGG